MNTVIIRQPIDPRRLAIVAQAMRDGFTIRPCDGCGGPSIVSRQLSAARCLACGRAVGATSRCWTCGGAITPAPVSPDLAAANAHGRANVEALAPDFTCASCGGNAEAARAKPAERRRRCRACRRFFRSVVAFLRCPRCREATERIHEREKRREKSQQKRAEIAATAADKGKVAV